MDLGIWLFLQATIRVFVEVSTIALQFSLESYTGLSAATTKFSRPSHFAKLVPSTLVTDLGIVMEVKLLQPQKQSYPKLSTEFGMVMEVKLMQSAKQLSPKLVTVLGMAMEVKLLQPEKQPSPKLLMVFGMVTEVKLLQP